MLSHKKHQPGLALSALLILLSLFMLQSCGGSGGSTQAGGGIGGTGKSVGTITAFGSIFVNKVEHDTTGVPITINGVSAGEGDLALGMKVAIVTSDNKAVSIDYEAEIRGPVEAVDVPGSTLTVLGQTVLVDGTTRFSNVTDLSGLSPGNDVDMSGFLDGNKKLRATYIALHAQPIQTFKVRGEISALDKNNKTFMINSLLADYSGLSGVPDLDDDPFVEVEADSGTYVPAIPKITASRIEISEEVPEGRPGEKVEIEGFIIWVNPVDQTDFKVNGQPVNTNAGTKFEHGTLANVAVNAHVEVKGLVNAGGILVADKLEFE